MVVSLLGTVAKLEAQVIVLTEEIVRLKKLKGRPKLKPSGMEKGTEPGAAVAPGARFKPRRKGRRRAKTPPKSARLIVDEDRVIPLTPGPGWRFKGYKRYTVQDLVIEVRVVRYWRACYRPDEFASSISYVAGSMAAGGWERQWRLQAVWQACSR